ncbi:protein NRT1/ PTR FAMILY 5.10-like [Malania oleifera]|uniref:protein NRT1/ PTR FAMILY 5.10-like n=1 Tax=Malania oleifera TaxID=397392 RepID=UPI0025AEB665|nr:protein NRT1/ PTR FAMILY 5.10-like [Malania oleifera]
MSTSNASNGNALAGASAGVESPLLEEFIHGDADKKHTSHGGGGWRAAYFIIGVEFAERFTYYGIGSNLISYLTGPLQQSTAAAAASVTLWAGMVCILPLVGAFVADSFLGRYRTIIISSGIYILGTGLLTLSAIVPSLSPYECQNSTEKASPCSASRLQIVLFYLSLYLVAIALGGHKPCIQAFGADQFDEHDIEECKAKSSYFNWCFFGLYAGTLIAILIVSYIQENLSWVLGFGLPCIVMVIALIIFLLGSKTYRYSVKGDEKRQLLRIGTVFAAATKNRQLCAPLDLSMKEPAEAGENLPPQGSKQFKFLDKAQDAQDSSEAGRKVCSVGEREEAKAMLRLVPIWVTSLVYAIVVTQPSTFFTKQGTTMERRLGSKFEIPAASLQAIISLSIVLLVPVYDRIFVPMAKSLSGKPSGITMLQRIGTGMLVSTLSMVTAAIVEAKRLEAARDHGLVDEPTATVPMSVGWLVPQYVLSGASDVLAVVGLQEFFYDQMPSKLKSVGLSVFLSIFGVGGFLSSFLVSGIDKVTDGEGRDSWFADNLNRAHLDYFYWLLAGLGAIQLLVYVYFAKSYVYNRVSTAG